MAIWCLKTRVVFYNYSFSIRKAPTLILIVGIIQSRQHLDPDSITSRALIMTIAMECAPRNIALRGSLLVLTLQPGLDTSRRSDGFSSLLSSWTFQRSFSLRLCSLKCRPLLNDYEAENSIPHLAANMLPSMELDVIA